MVHALSTTIGIIILAHFFYTSVVYQILLTFLAWIMLHISNKIGHGCRGSLSAIFCVSFNMICQCFIPLDWNKIFGVQMILAMKLISVAFDMDTDVSNQSSKPEKPKEHAEEPEEQLDSPEEILILHVPTFWKYFGYALCPGITAFGPWVSYKDYLAIYIHPRWNFTWLLKIMSSMMFGFLFLTISLPPFIQWFIPENQPIWISAYIVAMSERASHYFIYFISEASAVACGFVDVSVAEPLKIEVPRSLKEVVISWNKPMHQWFKKCMYFILHF